MTGNAMEKRRKATKHRLTRMGIEDRRQRIAKLMIQGLTPTQICTVLGKEYDSLSLKTVENDIGVINKQQRENVGKLDLDAEVGKMLASYGELERVAWRALSSAKQPREKTSGIKAVSEVLAARAKLLERAGLLVPVQRVVKEDGESWAERVRQLREERGLAQSNEEDEIAPLNEWLNTANNSPSSLILKAAHQPR